MDGCEVSNNCSRWPDGCWLCKFNQGEYKGQKSLYTPVDDKVKHPQALVERAAWKESKKNAKREKYANRDQDKVRVLKKAAKTEQRVKDTLNSGRINRDGDLKTSDLVIDVKLQSSRANPIILIEEFDKVQIDARRGNKKHGVLIIENNNGRRFVVMSEALFGEGFVN